jgi:cholesterol transport system auxiliary component
LSEPQGKGARLLAQRSFMVQHPSPTPDASGGVRALSAAVETLGVELEEWLLQ